MSQTPTLNDVIEAAVEDRLDNFWTGIPAEVLSFDSANRRATIRIMIANAVEDGSGTKFWYHPTIYSVPVVFPWGTSAEDGTGYGITFPFGPGDTGVYVVSTLPLHHWQSRGAGIKLNLDEDKGSRNNVAHGFLIPSVHAVKDVPVAVDQTAIVLHGKTKVGGPDGTEPTVMGNTFKSDLDYVLGKLKDFLNTVLNANSGGNILTDGGTAKVALFNELTSFMSNWSGRLTTKAEVK